MAGFLLAVTWTSPQVAANFTRVGGATRVETAVEAARFWLKPPTRAFMTPVTARRQVILRAAACAMTHNAPVLFTSPIRDRQRKVDALRRRWETQLGEQRPPRQLVVTYVTTEFDCIPGRATDRVRTLTDNAGLVPDFPSITAHEDLASVVVFAASKTPRSPADVTVALVLAAHLATSFDTDVSLVVLPRYIGADLRLDQQLRDQRDVVSRGVVVGREGSIPEDTRIVLRQVLRSQDLIGRGERLRAAFSDLGGLLTALLALLAAAAATYIAAPVIVQHYVPLREGLFMSSRSDRQQASNEPGPQAGAGDGTTAGKESPDTSVTAQRNPFAVGASDDPMITLFLRSRREVSGLYRGEETIGNTTFIKLKSANLFDPEREQSENTAMAFVPVDQVGLAGVEVRPGGGRPSRPPDIGSGPDSPEP